MNILSIPLKGSLYIEIQKFLNFSILAPNFVIPLGISDKFYLTVLNGGLFKKYSRNCPGLIFRNSIIKVFFKCYKKEKKSINLVLKHNSKSSCNM